MAYRKHRYDPDAPRKKREPLRFAGTFDDDIRETSVPMLVASILLDEIGFNEVIDRETDWDPVQWHASPGDRCRSVVLCGFGAGKRPALQNIADSFEDRPLDVLFHGLTSLDDLNRYAIADTLDRLHDAGCTRIFNIVASNVRLRWRIITEILHSDTTAQRVWGVYDRDPEAGDDVVDITFGYPEGFPGDLRQYMVGMAVGNHGLPVVGSILDGNTDDYFGFTDDEVEELLRRTANHTDRIDEMREWYGGFRFGNAEVYNPYSVTMYLKNGCRAKPYWNGDGLGFLSYIGCEPPSALRGSNGNGDQILLTPIRDSMTCSEVAEPSVEPSAVCSYLAMTGYLRAVPTNEVKDGASVYRVEVANREASSALGAIGRKARDIVSVS